MDTAEKLLIDLGAKIVKGQRIASVHQSIVMCYLISR